MNGFKHSNLDSKVSEYVVNILHVTILIIDIFQMLKHQTTAAQFVGWFGYL